MTEVPSERTPVTHQDAIDALRGAVLARGGDEILARLAIAQSHLETGGWASVWNNNLGNLRGSYNGMTTSIPGAKEYDDNGNLVTVSAGFRAYPSIAEGADDKIALLENLYPNAWASREPTSYVEGLWHGKIGSYFGVPPKDPFGPEGRAARNRYEAGLRARYAMLFGDTDFPKAPGAVPGAAPPSSSSPSAPPSSPHVLVDVHELPTLHASAYGVHVLIWQKLLSCTLTGTMDAPTIDATKNFQESSGLSPLDGVVGPNTWRAMLS